MSGNYTRYPASPGTLPAGSATAANQLLEIADLDSMLEAYKVVFDPYDFAGKVIMVGTADGSNNVSPLYSDSNGALLVSSYASVAGNASISNPAPGTSSFTLVAASPVRKGLIVVNDTDVNLFVSYYSTASSVFYTVRIESGGQWNMPAPIFTGEIFGASASTPTGNVLVTELS